MLNIYCRPISVLKALRGVKGITAIKEFATELDQNRTHRGTEAQMSTRGLNLTVQKDKDKNKLKQLGRQFGNGLFERRKEGVLF